MRRPEPAPRPQPRPAQRDRIPSARVVEFTDVGHVRWRVSERDARHDPGARGGWCLIFASAEAVRRVWDYPAAWWDLSRESLAALSWRR